LIRVFYYLRTFFVSLECLCIALSSFIYLCWGEKFDRTFENAVLNADAVKWIAALPVALCVWTIKEARDIPYPDEKSARILNKWPDYWKLKAHFYVGLLFCILFLIPLLFIWLFNWLESFKGMWIYFTLVFSLLVNAASFYLAKIKLKSILAQSE